MKYTLVVTSLIECKMLRFICFLFFFLLTNSRQCSCLDYYWRDYIDGVVPSDAIIAGQKSDGVNIHIGQAYVQNEGLIPAEIFPGVKEVYVPINGIQKVEANIKILCGPQQNLYWIATTSTSIKELLTKHTAVIGGHEDNGRGVLYVGRTNYNKDLIIGKITYFWGPVIDFNNNMTEKYSNSYEVLLVLENKDTGDRISKAGATAVVSKNIYKEHYIDN